MKQYIYLACAWLLLVNVSYAQKNPGVMGKKYAIELQSRYSNLNSYFDNENSGEIKTPFPFQLALDVKRAISPKTSIGIKTALISASFTEKISSFSHYKSDNAINFKAGVTVHFSALGFVSHAGPQFGVFLGMSSSSYTIGRWDGQNEKELVSGTEKDYSFNSVVIGASFHDKIFLHHTTPIYFIYGLQSIYHVNDYFDDEDIDNEQYYIARKFATRDLISVDFGIGYIF